MIYQALKVVSILSFLYYGASIFLRAAMVDEFDQFGLPQFRKLIGILELMGAAGLALGYFVPQLVVAASGGLTLLMLLGIAVRVRSGGPWVSAVPALAMWLINLYIFVYAVVHAIGYPGSPR